MIKIKFSSSGYLIIFHFPKTLKYIGKSLGIKRRIVNKEGPNGAIIIKYMYE